MRDDWINIHNTYYSPNLFFFLKKSGALHGFRFQSVDIMHTTCMTRTCRSDTPGCRSVVRLYTFILFCSSLVSSMYQRPAQQSVKMHSQKVRLDQIAECFDTSRKVISIYPPEDWFCQEDDCGVCARWMVNTCFFSKERQTKPEQALIE